MEGGEGGREGGRGGREGGREGGRGESIIMYSLYLCKCTSTLAHTCTHMHTHVHTCTYIRTHLPEDGGGVRIGAQVLAVSLSCGDATPHVPWPQVYGLVVLRLEEAGVQIHLVFLMVVLQERPDVRVLGGGKERGRGGRGVKPRGRCGRGELNSIILHM